MSACHTGHGDLGLRVGGQAVQADLTLQRPNRNRRRFWYPSSELTSPYVPEWDL